MSIASTIATSNHLSAVALPQLGEKSLVNEANAIHAMHCDLKQHLANATLIAVQIGHRLNAVKADLPHGEFTPWVEDNFDFTTRTARTYMKAAENFPLNSNGEIGQRDRKEIGSKTIKELASPKTEPKAKTEAASDLNIAKASPVEQPALSSDAIDDDFDSERDEPLTNFEMAVRIMSQMSDNELADALQENYRIKGELRDNPEDGYWEAVQVLMTGWVNKARKVSD